VIERDRGRCLIAVFFGLADPRCARPDMSTQAGTRYITHTCTHKLLLNSTTDGTTVKWDQAAVSSATQSPQPLTQYGAHDNRQAVISCWQFWEPWDNMHACAVECRACRNGAHSDGDALRMHGWPLCMVWPPLYGQRTRSTWLTGLPPCTASRCGGGEAFPISPPRGRLSVSLTLHEQTHFRAAVLRRSSAATACERRGALTAAREVR
jgi:hypothetical protein